jgi:hypothetical protein
MGQESLEHQFIVLEDVISKFISEYHKDADVENQFTCQHLSVEGVYAYVKIFMASPMIVCIRISIFLHQFVLKPEMLFGKFKKLLQDPQAMMLIPGVGIGYIQALHCIHESQKFSMLIVNHNIADTERFIPVDGGHDKAPYG